MTTFATKQLIANITLATGSFSGTTNQNSVQLDGYRMSAHIANAGGWAQCELDLRIYGLTLSVMNQLSTLGKSPVVIDTRNVITLQAVDGSNAPALVFTGTILQAYTDMSGAPESCFHISALAGLAQALSVQTVISTSVPTNVATLMGTLATAMNLTLESNGVETVVPPVALKGSLLEQCQTLAGIANIKVAVARRWGHRSRRSRRRTG